MASRFTRTTQLQELNNALHCSHDANCIDNPCFHRVLTKIGEDLIFYDFMAVERKISHLEWQILFNDIQWLMDNTSNEILTSPEYITGIALVFKQIARIINTQNKRHGVFPHSKEFYAVLAQYVTLECNVLFSSPTERLIKVHIQKRLVSSFTSLLYDTNGRLTRNIRSYRNAALLNFLFIFTLVSKECKERYDYFESMAVIIINELNMMGDFIKLIAERECFSVQKMLRLPHFRIIYRFFRKCNKNMLLTDYPLTNHNRIERTSPSEADEADSDFDDDSPIFNVPQKINGIMLKPRQHKCFVYFLDALGTPTIDRIKNRSRFLVRSSASVTNIRTTRPLHPQPHILRDVLNNLKRPNGTNTELAAILHMDLNKSQPRGSQSCHIGNIEKPIFYNKMNLKIFHPEQNTLEEYMNDKASSFEEKSIDNLFLSALITHQSEQLKLAKINMVEISYACIYVEPRTLQDFTETYNVFYPLSLPNAVEAKERLQNSYLHMLQITKTESQIPFSYTILKLDDTIEPFNYEAPLLHSANDLTHEEEFHTSNTVTTDFSFGCRCTEPKSLADIYSSETLEDYKPKAEKSYQAIPKNHENLLVTSTVSQVCVTVPEVYMEGPCFDFVESLILPTPPKALTLPLLNQVPAFSNVDRLEEIPGFQTVVTVVPEVSVNETEWETINTNKTVVYVPLHVQEKSLEAYEACEPLTSNQDVSVAISNVHGVEFHRPPSPVTVKVAKPHHCCPIKINLSRLTQEMCELVFRKKDKVYSGTQGHCESLDIAKPVDGDFDLEGDDERSELPCIVNEIINMLETSSDKVTSNDNLNMFAAVASKCRKIVTSTASKSKPKRRNSQFKQRESKVKKAKVDGTSDIYNDNTIDEGIVLIDHCRQDINKIITVCCTPTNDVLQPVITSPSPTDNTNDELKLKTIPFKKRKSYRESDEVESPPIEAVVKTPESSTKRRKRPSKAGYGYRRLTRSYTAHLKLIEPSIECISPRSSQSRSPYTLDDADELIYSITEEYEDLKNRTKKKSKVKRKLIESDELEKDLGTDHCQELEETSELTTEKIKAMFTNEEDKTEVVKPNDVSITDQSNETVKVETNDKLMNELSMELKIDNQSNLIKDPVDNKLSSTKKRKKLKDETSLHDCLKKQKLTHDLPSDTVEVENKRSKKSKTTSKIEINQLLGNIDSQKEESASAKKPKKRKTELIDKHSKEDTTDISNCNFEEKTCSIDIDYETPTKKVKKVSPDLLNEELVENSEAYIKSDRFDDFKDIKSGESVSEKVETQEPTESTTLNNNQNVRDAQSEHIENNTAIEREKVDKLCEAKCETEVHVADDKCNVNVDHKEIGKSEEEPISDSNELSEKDDFYMQSDKIDLNEPQNEIESNHRTDGLDLNKCDAIFANHLLNSIVISDSHTSTNEPIENKISSNTEQHGVDANEPQIKMDSRMSYNASPIQFYLDKPDSNQSQSIEVNSDSDSNKPGDEIISNEPPEEIEEINTDTIHSNCVTSSKLSLAYISKDQIEVTSTFRGVLEDSTTVEIEQSSTVQLMSFNAPEVATTNFEDPTTVGDTQVSTLDEYVSDSASLPILIFEGENSNGLRTSKQIEMYDENLPYGAIEEISDTRVTISKLEEINFTPNIQKPISHAKVIVEQLPNLDNDELQPINLNERALHGEVFESIPAHSFGNDNINIINEILQDNFSDSVIVQMVDESKTVLENLVRAYEIKNELVDIDKILPAITDGHFEKDKLIAVCDSQEDATTSETITTVKTGEVSNNQSENFENKKTIEANKSIGYSDKNDPCLNSICKDDTLQEFVVSDTKLSPVSFSEFCNENDEDFLNINLTCPIDIDKPRCSSSPNNSTHRSRKNFPKKCVQFKTYPAHSNWEDGALPKNITTSNKQKYSQVKDDTDVRVATITPTKQLAEVIPIKKNWNDKQGFDGSFHVMHQSNQILEEFENRMFGGGRNLWYDGSRRIASGRTKNFKLKEKRQRKNSPYVKMKSRSYEAASNDILNEFRPSEQPHTFCERIRNDIQSRTGFEYNIQSDYIYKANSVGEYKVTILRPFTANMPPGENRLQMNEIIEIKTFITQLIRSGLKEGVYQLQDGKTLSILQSVNHSDDNEPTDLRVNQRRKQKIKIKGRADFTSIEKLLQATPTYERSYSPIQEEMFPPVQVYVHGNMSMPTQVNVSVPTHLNVSGTTQVSMTVPTQVNISGSTQVNISVPAHPNISGTTQVNVSVPAQLNRAGPSHGHGSGPSVSVSGSCVNITGSTVNFIGPSDKSSSSGTSTSQTESLNYQSGLPITEPNFRSNSNHSRPSKLINISTPLFGSSRNTVNLQRASESGAFGDKCKPSVGVIGMPLHTTKLSTDTFQTTDLSWSTGDVRQLPIGISRPSIDMSRAAMDSSISRISNNNLRTTDISKGTIGIPRTTINLPTSSVGIPKTTIELPKQGSVHTSLPVIPIRPHVITAAPVHLSTPSFFRNNEQLPKYTRPKVDANHLQKSDTKTLNVCVVNPMCRSSLTTEQSRLSNTPVSSSQSLGRRTQPPMNSLESKSTTQPGSHAQSTLVAGNYNHSYRGVILYRLVILPTARRLLTVPDTDRSNVLRIENQSIVTAFVPIPSPLRDIWFFPLNSVFQMRCAMSNSSFFDKTQLICRRSQFTNNLPRCSRSKSSKTTDHGVFLSYPPLIMLRAFRNSGKNGDDDRAWLARIESQVPDALDYRNVFCSPYKKL